MQRILLFLTALFFINIVQAQSCLSGGITFSSQEAIDNFSINHPGCTEIEGDVIVEELVTNFNGLSQITRITGSLRVQNNSTLLSMQGWDNLSYIGGDLDFDVTWNLINLEGMEQLDSIGGKLSIVRGFDLENLNGLENLTSIGGAFNILENRLLTNITGLSSLTYIGGEFVILDNPELISTDGLENVAEILGGFQITNNDLLEQIVAMPNLTKINGDVLIGNEELTNIDGLAAVTEVTGDFVLTNNGKLLLTPSNGSLEQIMGNLLINNNGLMDINLLSNLNEVGGTFLKIERNFNLTTLLPLSNMVYENGNLSISGNSSLVDLSGLENIGSQASLRISGNNSLTSLTNFANIDSVDHEVVFSNNIVLASLEGLGNLRQIGGGLSILNNGCMSLVGLEGLTTINESLTIEFNDNLTSLSGLVNLTHLEENLVIDQNIALPNLNGLQGLTEIPGTIFIRENASLTSLTGFDNLATVIGFFILRANDNLTNMQGLNSLNYTGGGFFIEENNGLENLSGLESLATVEGGPLEITDNNALINIDGLENLEVIRSGIKLEGNESLTDLSALSDLSSIEGFLTISDNIALEGLSDLSNLIFIGGPMTISYNNNLQNLTELSNLFSIGGLFISNNELLENLTGLENISTVAGSISLWENESLESLAGLENIDTIGNHFFIFDNDALPNLEGINNLEYIGGRVEIARNDNLLEMNNLTNLTFIGDDLTIDRNPQLEHLDGLQNLISVDDDIVIRNNEILSSIGGIRNIAFSTANSLWIIDNPLLQVCGYTNICNYLADGNSALINDNGSGCNEEEEIFETCENFAKVNFLLFYDANQNAIMDDDEKIYSSANILLNPNEQILYPNSIFGGRVFLPDGNYSFVYNQEATPEFELTTDSSSYQVEIVNAITNVDSIKFGLFPDTLFKALKTTIVSENFRCNRNITLTVIGENTGTALNSGTLWLLLDEALLDYQPLEMPDTTDALGRIGWHFENLFPSEHIVKHITLSIPGPPDFPLGDSLVFASEIIYEDGEEVITGSKFQYEGVVRCSFDPNDKLVAPRYPEGYALLDEELVYTIRFQNTGNAEALEVVIRDTLDSNLDPNTFRIIGSSHEEFLSTSLTDNQYLTFEFMDINLPDSTSNLEGSQGYVAYTIKAYDNLPEETIIENTAGIYFDFNPPVITNTTENMMVSTFDADNDGFLLWEDCDDSDPSINPDALEIINNGIDEDCDGLDMIVSTDELAIETPKVLPNPFYDNFKIIRYDASTAAVEIRSLTGKLILNQQITTVGQIDLSKEPAGVYLMTIKAEGSTFVQKVIKMK